MENAFIDQFLKEGRILTNPFEVWTPITINNQWLTPKNHKKSDADDAWEFNQFAVPGHHWRCLLRALGCQGRWLDGRDALQELQLLTPRVQHGGSLGEEKPWNSNFHFLKSLIELWYWQTEYHGRFQWVILKIMVNITCYWETILVTSQQQVEM